MGLCDSGNQWVNIREISGLMLQGKIKNKLNVGFLQKLLMVDCSNFTR